MVVGICRLRLMLPESQTLKDKRAVLRSIKDRVRQKFNCAIAEVDENDNWQAGVLGIALIANQRRFVESMLERVVGFVDTLAKISDEEKEFIQYGDEVLAEDEFEHWEPGEAPPPSEKSGRPRAPKPRDLAPFPWETGEDD